jgi:protein kinase C substrate 80K-H
MALPASIPDGFLGYAAPKPRQAGTNDQLSLALDAWDSLQSNGDTSEPNQKRRELDEDLDREKQLGSELRQVQDEIQSLVDSIGYEEPMKFGPDGELYALKDECYSHDTGKYVYEICLFGSAKQKEGKGGGSGTDLGRWAGATIDEETGRRVWRWENGQRCWNGPNRSATAYITCGAKNRVLSVEEPEICKYELQMESYIACDEAFRSMSNLDPA